MTTTMLRLGRADLALHHLVERDGPQLLLLHGLGERAPDAAPDSVAAHWPGSIAALDFLGHGASTRPRGGGYTCEQLMGDADAAMAVLGEATVLGRGLGGYVALLLAGGRPDVVRGTIIADGPGIAGGGPSPNSPTVVRVSPPISPEDPDGFALGELARDIRPPDYAATFARQATTLSPLESPICVTAIARPDWLVSVLNEPGVQETTLGAALRSYAAAQGTATA